MEGITIHKKLQSDNIPWDLLLLADPSKERVESYIHSGEVFLATINSLIVGAYVLIKKSDVMELVNIAVREEHQGKGIGKALLLHAIACAKKAKVKSIEVGTGNTSIHQLAFYQKHGFRIIGIEKGYFVKNYKEKIKDLKRKRGLK